MSKDVKIVYGDQCTVESLIRKEEQSGLYLPHFQREFVWDIKAQKALICSLLSGVPIGGVLILEGYRSDYAYRILGHDLWDSARSITPCLFLLDGQQRLSALKTICYDPFSAHSVKLLQTKGFKEEIHSWRDVVRKTDFQLRNRWFINLDYSDGEDIFGTQDLMFNKHHGKTPEEYMPYIDYEKILISSNTDFSPSQDLKTVKQKAVSKRLIPLWLLMGGYEKEENLDRKEVLKRILEEIALGIKSDIEMDGGKKIEQRVPYNWSEALLRFLEDRICNLTIPDITLKRGKDQLGIGIAIFEATNRSGTRLSAYDLISARMANKDHDKNLTRHIEDVLKETTSLHDVINNKSITEWYPYEKGLGLWGGKMPTPLFKQNFLACLGMECFLRRKKKSPSKSKRLTPDVTKSIFLFDLSDTEIVDAWEDAVRVFLKIFQFLHVRCGLIKISDFHYRLMSLPLYKVFRELNIDSRVLARCEYWYWASLFSGRFRDNQNQHAIDDCEHLYGFCSGGKNPFENREASIFKDKGYSDFENLGRYSENKNFNDGLDSIILQYLLSDGVQDLGTDRVYITTWAIANGKAVPNESHIVPTGGSNRDDEVPVNSPLNKTYLVEGTNKQMLTDTTAYHTELDDYQDSHLLPDNFADLVNAYMIETNAKEKEKKLRVLLDARFKKIERSVRGRLQQLLS